MNYTTRRTCRICKSKKLKQIFSLGDLYVSAFIKKKDKTIEAPLELILCQKCGLLQLKHTAPQEILYKRYYSYKSGINPVIVDDLKDIVKKAIKIAKPKEGDIFLDIGANDGTLLSFVPKKCYSVGVEPAINLQKELKKNCDKKLSMFWEKTIVAGAKIITAIGMFYDSEDPNKFIANVKKSLAKDGLFIAQLMTLAPMVKNNDISNICHEHLEYYSYKALRYLFEKNGLEIFKVEENKVNGGSYRLYARHYKKGSIKYPEKINLKAFIKNIKENKRETLRFILEEFSAGKKIYGYGASTKGNTILQYYHLCYPVIEGVADKNPEKWGKYTVGTNIPIVSEKEARKKADYFFILPWGFQKSFIKRESKFIKQGGKFIVSIPKFKIIK